MERLLRDGYELMIETSGERPVENVPKAVHKIIDVKCPGSGEAGRFRITNLASLTDRDEIKFVITNRDDYEFARDFIRNNALEAVAYDSAFSAQRRRRLGARRRIACWIHELVEWMLADGLNARLKSHSQIYLGAAEEGRLDSPSRHHASRHLTAVSLSMVAD